MSWIDLADRAAVGLLRLQGVTSRIVPTRVGPVHLLDAPGAGSRTLILLHGLGSGAADQAPLIRMLRPHFRRVIAPDLPGHGASPPPAAGMRGEVLQQALSEALDRVCPEPAVVFGNSLGGLAALRWAIARPERVPALVLASPAGAPDRMTQLVDGFRFGSHRDAAAFVRRVHATPPLWTPLLAYGVRARFERPAVRALIDGASTGDLVDPAALRGLSLPTLLLWGRQERILPDSHLRFFEQHLPHAVVERPDGWGHAPMLDAPADLAARIVAFTVRIQRGSDPVAAAASAR